MYRKLLLLITFLIAAIPAFGQIYSTQYRLPNQQWMELNSEHFRVVYPEAYRAEALRSLSILELSYSEIKQLVGGDLQSFPFILNPENDNSNGFVSPINFRSEVELSPIIGKSMNPQSGGWLELVLPHELVHALHFSVNPRSVTRFLGIFSPDMRRAVHAAAPLGVHEGIAVHYESHNDIPHSGRGNYPHFTNQFWSLVNNPGEWSMGQLLHTTDFTPPFARHYIGGYEFTNWLLNEYGNDTVRNAIEFHYHYPFLGYGTALRHATGFWPGKLYDQFDASTTDREENRRAAIAGSTDALSNAISFSATCRRMQRPTWVNSETILFFARSCNRPTGFYTYHTREDSFDLVEEVSISPDHLFDFSAETGRLFYSRYHTDPFYNNVFRGDLHMLNLYSGKEERLTKRARLFSPAVYSSELLALQTEAHEMNLVSVDPSTGDVIRRFEKPDESTVVQAAPNPHRSNQTAILGRIESVQALWIENLSDENEIMQQEPLIAFEGGSIFDLSWHPSESRLLFVSDHSGTMDVYEYNQESDAVYRLTNSFFNAFEASYSPDGERIAYVGQEGNEQRLFLLSLDDALYREVPRSEWSSVTAVTDRLSRPLLNKENQADFDTQEWKEEPLQMGLGWLKPRFWAPTYEEESGFDRFGVTLESVNLMNTQSYFADVSWIADRLWYDLTYINKSFYPGFRIEAYNEPLFFNVSGETEAGEEINTLLLQQLRGAAFKMPIPIYIRRNARFSSFYIEPQYFLNQFRFYDPNASSAALSDFSFRHEVGLRSVLNLRLRQFTRDVQPNSGWSIYAEARQALNSDSFNISSEQVNIDGTFVKRRGFRAGIIKYLSPLRRWNQSLALSAEAITQTRVPVYGTLSRFSDLFSDVPFPGANNVGYFNARYTIPVIYPDDGGLLLPFYLSNIYLVLFSQTTADLNQSIDIRSTRSVFGAGIRSRFRLSNLAFDVGISIGWEPTRNSVTYHFGSF